MESYRKIPDGNLNDFIDSFISTQVIGRGLDERTEKAYRLDLEHFYKWLESSERQTSEEAFLVPKADCQKEAEESLPLDGKVWKKKMEQYLGWLSQEKRLRSSTISRKYRVFGYFLAYLAREGVLSGNSDVLEERTMPVYTLESDEQKRGEAAGPLSRKEVDAFFRAIRREAEEVDSDFRRRLCLRDHVMMGLLFYHGIEISQLLNMETSDYDRRKGILFIRKKKEKGYSVQLFSREIRGQMEAWLDEHEYFEHYEEFQGRMFLSKLGRPLSMKMVILIFEKYRMLAGIEKEFTPKDLKNSLERYGIELAMEQCE